MRKRLLLAAFVASVSLPAGGQSAFEDAVELDVSSLQGALAPSRAIRQAPVHVDLSGQFIDGSRSQSWLNSCHAFVAVALIESAYFRRYGVHTRLSEADLYVRTNALPVFPFLRSFQGGLARIDLRRALEEGVLPGDHYAAFAERYAAFKTRFFKFLDSRASVAAELLPESLGPEADAEREKVRDEISDFKVGGASFFSFIGANARSVLKKDRVACSVKRRERVIARQLDAGRPVAVGLHTGWTKDPAWRRNATGEGGSHYFMVTGYDRGADGLVFHTRNTWGSGNNPDLAGGDLCEIYGLTWLRAPNDPD